MILFNIPFVVLGVGVLVSAGSQTTGQGIQLAIFFLVPQILLSGMIFPLSAVPGAIRWLAYVFPLTDYTVMTQGIQPCGTGRRFAVAPIPRSHRHGCRCIHICAPVVSQRSHGAPKRRG
jgi:uncharacterized phage infection (PIP) family protein YhgE